LSGSGTGTKTFPKSEPESKLSKVGTGTGTATNHYDSTTLEKGAGILISSGRQGKRVINRERGERKKTICDFHGESTRTYYRHINRNCVPVPKSDLVTHNLPAFLKWLLK
jgi:hypothetical protein